MHAASLARAHAALAPREQADLDGYVSHCLTEGQSLERLADDYKLVVDDTLREQVFFWRHGRYRHARYDDVAAAVYLDDRYMTAYMRGLALTAFFWPNHARIRRYFDQILPGGGAGRYLEVGPGHGFYFLSAMRRRAFSSYDGIDISPTSVALTGRLLDSGSFGRFEGFRLHVGDFLATDPGGPFDMLVMGEVLEHVERPQAFLARARAVTSRTARLFVTTCVNSPAFDHIHLFSTPEEIFALVAAAGLRVLDQLVLPYDGTTLPESMAKRLAVNVAMVLGHA
jgi:SAM-dependent methyltransferase